MESAVIARAVNCGILVISWQDLQKGFMLRIVYVKIKEEARWGYIKLVKLKPLKEYDIYYCIVLAARFSD